MTYVHKLARRIARLRTAPLALIAGLAACTGAEPTGLGSDDGNALTVPGISPAPASAPSPADTIKPTTASPSNTSTPGVGSTSATLTSVLISPASVALTPGKTQQFKATGKMSDGTTKTLSPTYKATGGTISAGGLYTAGSSSGSFRVIATDPSGKADTSSVTITASTSSGASFTGNFETGNLLQYRMVQQCTPNRVTVYSASSQPTWPTPREGTYAARFNVYDSDVYPCTPTENPRAQIGSSNYIKAGDEDWAAFSLYLPTNMPEVPSHGWVILQSFYGSPGGGSGAAHLALTHNESSGATQFEYPGGWRTPIVKGRWHDFMVHVKFSKDPSVGWVELWYNGVQQTFPGCNCTRFVKQTINDETTSALHSKLAFYRQAGMWPGAVAIFFDRHRVGPTRASVE
jgi:hypothetical protein